MTGKDAFELERTIDATAMQVLFAFAEAPALAAWMKTKHALVQPRPGGLFVLQWEPGSEGQDDLLGPLGGVLAGVLDRSMAGHFIHFGSLHWLTPKGEVYGPTRLEVDVFSKNDPRRKPTLARIRVSGFQSGERWERYRDLSHRAWEKSISSLASFCETRPAEDAERMVGVLGTTYLAEAVLKERRIS
jgi:uncharacterized protein YndB with AHSA1/START domain